jgi:hypothetical protein
MKGTTSTNYSGEAFVEQDDGNREISGYLQREAGIE